MKFFRERYAENELTALEKGLFRTLFCSSLFLLVVAMIFTWIETWSPVGVLIIAIYFASILLYGWLIFRHKVFSIGYFGLCLFNNCIMMPACYFICGGMFSGIPCFFMLGLFSCALCTEKRYRFMAGGASILFHFACFAFELLDPARVNDMTRQSRIIDIIFSFMFCGSVYFIFMRAMMSSYTRMYNQQIQALNKKNEVFEDMVDAEKEQNTALRRMRHDLRHHTNVLVELLEAGKEEEALSYLKHSREVDRESSKVLYCANGTLNGILNYISRKCRKCGVRLEADADVPEDLPIEPDTLVAIIANVLENAVHGADCSGQPEKGVWFKACRKADKLVLICENSCSDSVVVEGGMLKEKSTGIQSILGGVESCDGAISYTRKGDRIICHILLNLES